MNLLIEYTVFSGFVTIWFFAGFPTRRSVSVKPTTDGVVLSPSLLAMTAGSLPSITATQLFVVPRSIPMIFPILSSLHPYPSICMEAFRPPTVVR